MLWKELTTAAAKQLKSVGVSAPDNDARLLAAHVLNTSKAQLSLLLASGETASLTDQNRFKELVTRRSERFPLQYLTGVAPFRRCELRVGPGVFIPRPETEAVAQLAIDRALRLVGEAQAPVIADLGAGSGAIALSIAAEVPQACVYAVEISERALAWAQKNINRSGLKNIKLVSGNFKQACPELNGRLDIVISNPPYIPAAEVPQEPEVRLHEPELALYGGGWEGMDAPCAVIGSAVRLLRSGGYFVLEHAQSQAAAVTGFMRQQGVWEKIAGHDDLSGRARATSAYLLAGEFGAREKSQSL